MTGPVSLLWHLLWPLLWPLLWTVLGTADDWHGVDFRSSQFDLVVRQAQEHWANPFDSDGELRGYRRAAELALWTMDSTVELLPDGYLDHLSSLANDPWKPALTPDRLLCQGKPVAGLVLVAAEVSRRDPAALEAAWKTWRDSGNQWGRAEFLCTMAWVERSLPLSDDRRERANLAWINAASGYLKAHDRHSDVVAKRFWERVTQSEQVAESAEPGISIEHCELKGKSWCVADVRPGSAAWLAQVRVHDRLDKVADTEAVGRTAADVQSLLSGAPASLVALQMTVARTQKPRTIVCKRDEAITLDTAAEALGTGEIHLWLRDFVPGTAARLGEVLRGALKAAKVKKISQLRGLVLDLRGNPGGSLNEAVAVADQLLGDGLVMTAKWKGRSDDRRTTAQPTDMPGKMVVLIDRRCASACEILAGALQDRGRATLLGTRTFGKASMQEVKQPSLLAGFYIKLTIGHYFTPNGRDLDTQGLQPDVALPAEVTSSFASVAEPLRESAKCVSSKGKAPQLAVANPAPRRKVDTWLLMAQDWLHCAP